MAAETFWSCGSFVASLCETTEDSATFGLFPSMLTFGLLTIIGVSGMTDPRGAIVLYSPVAAQKMTPFRFLMGTARKDKHQQNGEEDNDFVRK
jgi:hypothetical protein